MADNSTTCLEIKNQFCFCKKQNWLIKWMYLRTVYYYWFRGFHFIIIPLFQFNDFILLFLRVYAYIPTVIPWYMYYTLGCMYKNVNFYKHKYILRNDKGLKRLQKNSIMITRDLQSTFNRNLTFTYRYWFSYLK